MIYALTRTNNLGTEPRNLFYLSGIQNRWDETQVLSTELRTGLRQCGAEPTRPGEGVNITMGRYRRKGGRDRSTESLWAKREGDDGSTKVRSLRSPSLDPQRTDPVRQLKGWVSFSVQRSVLQLPLVACLLYHHHLVTEARLCVQLQLSAREVDSVSTFSLEPDSVSCSYPARARLCVPPSLSPCRPCSRYFFFFLVSCRFPHSLPWCRSFPVHCWYCSRSCQSFCFFSCPPY